MCGYKFEGKRFGTVGFVDEVPIEIQKLIWEMIDKKLAELGELDYLQIFRMSKRNTPAQLIEHQQEELNPFCYKESFPVEEVFSGKVFVIDSPAERSVVAMLAEEY